MNLSERLDAARAKNTEDTPDKFALRMVKDDETYDGQSVRTGEQMTADTWNDLKEGGEGADLPAWNPNRAHESGTGDWQLDLTGPEAVVGNIGPDGDVQTFEMPAWADGEKVYNQLVDGARVGSAKAAGTPWCPSCDSAAEVTKLDLLGDTAHLECKTCGFRWVDTAKPYAPRGH